MNTRVFSPAERTADFAVGRQVEYESGNELGLGVIVASWVDTRHANPDRHRRWILVVWPDEARPTLHDPTPECDCPPLRLVPLPKA